METSAPSPTNATYAPSTRSPSPTRRRSPSSAADMSHSRRRSNSSIQKHPRSPPPSSRRTPTSDKSRSPYPQHLPDNTLSDTDSDRVLTPLPKSSIPRHSGVARRGRGDGPRHLVDLQTVRNAVRDSDEDWSTTPCASRGKIACSICHTTLAIRAPHNLVRHLYVHLPSRYYPFTCPATKCSKQYASTLRSEVRRHYTAIHRREWKPDLESHCVHEPNYEAFLGLTNLARTTSTCYSCQQPVPRQKAGPNQRP